MRSFALEAAANAAGTIVAVALIYLVGVSAGFLAANAVTIVAVAGALLGAVAGSIAYARLMRRTLNAVLDVLPDNPEAARVISRAMPWLVGGEIDEIMRLLRAAREQARKRGDRDVEREDDDD